MGVTTALTDSAKRLFSSCSAMILSLAARSSSFAARSFFVSSVFSRFSSSVHGAELDIDSLKDAACGDDFSFNTVVPKHRTFTKIKPFSGELWIKIKDFLKMFPEVSLAFFCKPCVECLWRNSDMFR